MKTFYITLFLILSLIIFSNVEIAAQTRIKIGTQTWTCTNLNVSIFSNGDTIPEAKSIAEWVKAGQNKQPAWCYYNNDPSNGVTYGKLYNWYAVNDPRGLAPKGWHIPTDTEWTILTDYLGGMDSAGKKIKSSSGWNGINGNNSSGFNAIPGGNRHNGGEFLGLGYGSRWWSATENGIEEAWCRMVFFDGDEVTRICNKKNCDGKDYGLYIRCLIN